MERLSSLDIIIRRFRELGADRFFYKNLQENDNSKQQIYLCDRPGSVVFINRPWSPSSDEEIPKLDLDLHWISSTTTEKAQGAKLIYYPAYPEVRLSGILKGCSLAPSELMQPVPKDARTGSDNRILFIGATPEDKLYCYVSDGIHLDSELGESENLGVLRSISLDKLSGRPAFTSPDYSADQIDRPEISSDKPKELPYWAAVSFIVYCARLLSAQITSDDGEPPSQRATIVDSLDVCSRRAEIGGSPTDSDVVIVGNSYFDPYDVAALRGALSSFYDATWNTYSDLADDPDVGAVTYRIWLCVDLAAKAIEAAFPDASPSVEDPPDYLSAAETIVSCQSELESLVWPTLYRLRRLAVEKSWTDVTPIPSSIFDNESNDAGPRSLRFRPRARIIRTIGDRLISGPEAAVIELVKNSYDADASVVKISISPQNEDNPSQIIFKDDGHGMSFDDIQNKWMEPATSDKGDRLTSPGGRRLLGSKGIGRFASARLGRLLELRSTKHMGLVGGLEFETSTINALDWSIFDQTEYLDDVSFAASSGLSAGPSGTILNVLDLRDEWNEKSLSKLHLELRRLLSPLEDGTAAFKIILDLSACTQQSCGFDGISILRRSSGVGDQLSSDSDSFEVRPFPILDACDYLVDGIFDENGNFEGTFTIRREGSAPEVINLHVPLQDGEQSCGIVLVKLSIFDREATSIRSTAQKAGFGHLGVRDARKLLDGMAGIAIYRDSFRVRPYGDAENDWLTLDTKRVQNPTQKIGRNQVAGVIVVESEASSNLIERSSREGLEENGSYRRLQSLILYLLSEEVEPRRRSFRIENGLERKKNSGFSDALSKANLEWTQKIIERLSPQDRPEAQKLVNSESSKLTDHLRDLAERQAQLEAQATLGLIIGEVMHQGNTPLTFIENEVERLIYWWPTLFDDTADAKSDREEAPRMLNGMNASASSLRTLFDALSPLAGAKRGDPIEYDIHKRVLDTIFLFRTRAESLGIDFDVDPALANSKAFGYPADIATTLTNLFDNSIYWLSHYRVTPGKISISLVESDDNAVVSLSVSDNGRGVQHKYFSSIFEVGFSTKPNGTGLGLSIAREAMFRSGGDLEIAERDGGSEFIVTVPGITPSARKN
ncbi:TPA: sensor histidine kinase [Stenotrophomonas maltophilia]|nr:sensor histidine kinase [Stenotrophomonas maltophilia]